MEILNLFNVNNVFFEVLGYQMSYIEFFGTILTFASVWLAAKNKISNWPVSIIAGILFAVLFYQIQLYSDLLEQFYYIIFGFMGWILWKNPSKSEKEKKIEHNSRFENVVILVITIFGSIILGFIMNNIHTYLPSFFKEQASYAYVDAFTTVLSFVAYVLLAMRRLESWYLWILVDIIGIGLYFAKDVLFLSILYVTFLIIATKGLIDWRKIYSSQFKLK